MRHRIGNQELHGRILVMIFAFSREIYIPESVLSKKGIYRLILWCNRLIISERINMQAFRGKRRY